MLRIATLNTQNLGPREPAWRLSTLAEALVSDLETPDLLCLQEICGSEPPDGQGRVAATGTLGTLRAAVTEAGGPCYQFLECAPRSGEQGGKAGADIRTCLGFRADRLCPLSPATGELAKLLNGHPARALGDEEAAFAGDAARGWVPSRRPIAAAFQAMGRPLLILGCHLKSMRAPSPELGSVFKAQRRAQGEYLGQVAARAAVAHPELLVVIAGDFNDTPGSTTLAAACGEVLADPGARLPARRRFTAIHEGGRITLDYVLLSRWAAPAAKLRVPHLNTSVAPPVRFSDHDPVLVKLPWPDPEAHTGF